MKAFHTIAIPHKDVLEGKLTMDVFAADLWEVAQNRGPDEYKDAETFFRRTYLTEGLKNLLSIVEKRLQGRGGDSVIQLQTPFGGGKTHALIAMYHKAVEWSAQKVVVVGTALSMEITLWGSLEKQLTGKMTKFTSRVSPGKEAIRELLGKRQPVIILMDEVLEYVVKAAGVKVEESTLAAQTIAFIQELTEATSTLEKACLVLTLPSSIIEHYDENAERLYQQLQKVSGRIEKIYTPVQENEIAKIIRRRLFSDVVEAEEKKVVSNFMKYAEKEGVLPIGTQPSEYRDRFLESYPFMPDVIDILYHRWGSYPTFQRTRGVLRLLSLVIHSLRTKNKPYVSLADFDLGNQDIRQELLKHIGPEFNSVIGADITNVQGGSSKVDASLGNAYRGLNLGTRAATAIFLYSFSGGQERGATLGEIKRSATTIDNPASGVAEAAEQLKSKLFFLQSLGDKYFFSNQPNLNRILLTAMENVRDDKIIDAELELLRASISGWKLKVLVWDEDPGNIPDTTDLKLVIVKRENRKVIGDILKSKGQTPRVHRNTLFFLYPLESERAGFVNNVKHSIAYDYIERDKGLNLSEDQKKEIKKEQKKVESELKESVRRLYRMLAIPTKEGTKEFDLGIPTFGVEKKLDEEIYERLRSEGEILERIAPLVIKEKYLVGRKYVLTEQLYQSSLKTPGEPRPINKGVLEHCINEGVCAELFGLGELEGTNPVCRYFKLPPTVSFSAKEVLICEALCREQMTIEELEGTTAPLGPASAVPSAIGEGKKGMSTAAPAKGMKPKVQLKFSVPKGKVSSIMGLMNLLQSKFENLEIEITASNGGISEQDYEDKVKEIFRQLGIEVEER
jgi:hypothetical protein